MNCYAQIKDENCEKCPVCGKKLIVFDDVEDYQNFNFNLIKEVPEVKKMINLILMIGIIFFILPFFLFIAISIILNIVM